jgi:hypothetical protein
MENMSARHWLVSIIILIDVLLVIAAILAENLGILLFIPFWSFPIRGLLKQERSANIYMVFRVSFLRFNGYWFFWRRRFFSSSHAFGSFYYTHHSFKYKKFTSGDCANNSRWKSSWGYAQTHIMAVVNSYCNIRNNFIVYNNNN